MLTAPQRKTSYTFRSRLDGTFFYWRFFSSIILFSIEGYDVVHGPCCGRWLCACPWSALLPEASASPEPCGSTWSTLLLTVKGKEATLCHIDDYRLTVGKERHRRLLWQLLLQILLSVIWCMRTNSGQNEERVFKKLTSSSL